MPKIITMDYSSALKSCHNHNPLLLSKPFPPKPHFKSSLSLLNKPQRAHLYIRCSSRNNPQNPTISSLFKPAAITIAAAAALFLYRFPNPSHASPIPTQTQSETLTEADDEQREREIEAQLDSQPNNPRLLRLLLDLKIKSNKIYDAVSILDQLTELEPDEPELPLLKSHLLIQFGDAESAKNFLEQIIDKDPFSVEAYHGLIMAHREAEEGLGGVLERIENAMELCRKAKRREDLRDFKLLKGQVKVVEGKYEEAIRVYEDLVKEEPRDFRPYLCQGIVYTLMNKKGEAEKKFERYRRLVPKGHPYSGFFDESMIATKVLGQLEENRRRSGLKA